jgi:hypothetical protein
MGPEQRLDQHQHRPVPSETAPEAGQPLRGLPEPQVEPQTHEGDVNRPELHLPHDAGDVQRDEPILLEQHEQRELIEGIPQELPKALEDSESETPEQRSQRRARESSQRWRQQHPERARELSKRWRESTQGRQYNHEWRQQHPERVREHSRAYYKRQKAKRLQEGNQSNSPEDPNNDLLL